MLFPPATRHALRSTPARLAKRLFLALFLQVTCAEAGVIRWDDPLDYSSPQDVLTEGVLTEAFNATGTNNQENPTVNGVLFSGTSTLLGGDASINFLSGDTGDTAYNNLLNSLDYGTPDSLTIGDGLLQEGHEYLIQIWFVDERNNYDHRAMQYGDGNGNLSQEVNDQFIVGTFIATDSGQTLTINGVNTGTPHLSAYQLRDLGVPVRGVIDWDEPKGYEDEQDVVTDGFLVEAFNASGEDAATDLTLNGVPFTATTTLLPSDANTDFLQNDTGSLAYNQFLNSLDYGSRSSFEIGGGQLQEGKEYLLQAWYVDERSGTDHRSMQFGDGAGNLSGEVNDGFVTGTFIANAPSQILTITSSASSPHFTGYQLRDLSSPIPVLSAEVEDTVSAPFIANLVFSASVTGLQSSDFQTSNATLGAVTGADRFWSLEIFPVANGDVEVKLPADAVIDGDGHGNVVSNTLSTTYVSAGSDQPVPSLSTSTNKADGPYLIDLHFSEEVTGLTEDDFQVSGGRVSGIAGSGSQYSIEITPEVGGDITVLLPRNSVTDLDGDGLLNIASNTLTTPYFIEVTVQSPEELLPYLRQDNVCATLAPGTYTIDAEDVRDIYGTPRFEFWGSNSCYDFTDVTINFAADIYDEGLSMNHFQIFGNDNVLKNLTMVDLCDKYGQAGKSGGVNLTIDGSNNRVEGFHMTIRGSYPYGYGDCFGKGGNYTIKHWKHSGLLVRGNDNHVLNCILDQKSYGHCIFMQAAHNPTIEGCYVEAEVRSTDDMLAETSGPAYDIDFLTVWGFRLPPGYMKSTVEGGIRAYNAGNTYIDGVWYSRGTSNPTILNNTLVNTRTGVTLTHATGEKYVAGCTTIGTERGYAIGSGIIENCYSDVKHGPAFGVDYERDSGITADITILPHEGDHYNGSRHVAYILGRDHNLTFRGLDQNPETDLEINIGGDKRIESSYHEIDNYLADDITVNNLTGFPLILDDNAEGNAGQSIGLVTDQGSANNFGVTTWDITTNLSFYGTTTQSSTAHGAIASLATDQNTSGQWNEGSVTHTEIEDRPWWKIDLQETFHLTEIKIWNRTNSNESRLSDYDVTILDHNEQPVWTSYQSTAPLPSLSLFPEMVGQYVLIQLRGNDALSLAEVEIFGSPAAPYSLLEEWRFANFGSHENAGLAEDSFDADQDGLPNLLEYALGLNPMQPQGQAPLTLRPADNSDELEIAFSRIADPSLQYTLEGTSDPASLEWDAIWLGSGEQADTVIVPRSSWPEGEERYFFRLRISRL
ncbi:MAG: Ig-like domain-containing protein [Verrucomicrobiota bacterium JB023]|nr:Ig-like domain-containing protein [Verrucomicrobiota bacterium JB023]